jgi:hypothetical protein
VNDWVSVKTKKPPLDRGILVTDGKIVCHVKVFGRNNFYTTPENVHAYDCESFLDYRDITHWMSEPIPPKFEEVK